MAILFNSLSDRFLLLLNSFGLRITIVVIGISIFCSGYRAPLEFSPMRRADVHQRTLCIEKALQIRCGNFRLN